jgi:ADP-ribose pyrophosphatase
MIIISTNTLYKTKWLKFKEKIFIDKANKEKAWEYIERNNNRKAAVIIPKDSKQGKTVLIKQFRVPFEKEIIEFPAGLIDSGETPEQTAYRELFEETGFKALKTISISPKLCTSPGLTNEVVYIIEVEIDSTKQHDQTTEGSEDIEVLIIDTSNLKAELDKLSKNQYIIDSKVWSYALSGSSNII